AVVLFAVTVPAVVEEAFFRGYLQRRLLRRLRPGVALPVATAAFAAFHLQPHHVLSVVPIGLWLGYLAWRFGSIWPGVLAHGLYNAIACAAAIATAAGYLDDPPLTTSLAASGVSLLLLGALIAGLGSRALPRPRKESPCEGSVTATWPPAEPRC